MTLGTSFLNYVTSHLEKHGAQTCAFNEKQVNGRDTLTASFRFFSTFWELLEEELFRKIAVLKPSGICQGNVSNDEVK